LIDVKQWGGVAWNTMKNAFLGCNNLNITATDLPNLSNVSNTQSMFLNCSTLNGPSNINSWNTAAVTNMSEMFKEAEAFNQNIGLWNTAAVTDMDAMFLGAIVFNQNIGSWNTAAVTDMGGMFQAAYAFNQNIVSWNTKAVTDMKSIIRSALNFNQNIGSWYTAAVTDMSEMFYNATAFNQDIGSWNINNVINMTDIFFNSGINVSNYDAILTAWNTVGYTNKNLGNASHLKYCATAIRTTLTTAIASGGKGWIITGDALSRTCSSPCQSVVTLSSLNVPTDDMASGTIIKQANATTGTITATHKITNTANVTYRAGKSITLDPGFKADNGVVFKTEFGGCI
jgi:surface protein